MPLVAILAGLILADLGLRGTEHEFAKQAAADFGGSEFWTWAGAMLILGSLGYIRQLRSISTGLMALVLVVLFLKNGSGAFGQIASLVEHPPAPAPPVPLSAYASSGSGSGGLFSSLLGGGSGSGGASGSGGLFSSLLGGGSGSGGGGAGTLADLIQAAPQVAQIAGA